VPHARETHFAPVNVDALPKATQEVITSKYESLVKELEPLRQRWIEKYSTMFGPPPVELPPLREVNHSIRLIDPDAQYSSRPPRCAKSLFPLLREKTERYVKAGWWKQAHGRNAIPLLCIPKISKELKLRTVIDARERNANTVIDATPLPNQDMIREDVAAHTYVSVIDMTDAYEQMRIVPEDVPKTLFASPLGTYVSNTLQQGDCNGPSSWQRLMTFVFRERIGVSVWVYLDDIYVFSNTIEEHEDALKYVLGCLKKERLYISKHKFQPYAVRFNCLGHYRDENGLQASSDKLDLIRRWPTPATYHDVQRFLGIIEYISRFLPNVSAYSTPLSGMCSNGLPFVWRALHDKCFESIKAIASRKLSLQPIDRTNQAHVWVVCDACPSGCGAYYGQGDDWQTMRPSGFMSKKFTDAQRSYFTYEHETLGVIEALKKWDDALLGLPEIRVVTDHEALRTFMQKSHTGPRQIRWSQWLTRFRLKFIHIPGTQNRSADALSRIFENPNSHANLEDLSTVDILLDMDGDDLTEQRMEEGRKYHLAPMHAEPKQHEATHASRPPRIPEANNLTVATSATKTAPLPFTWKPEIGGESRPDLERLCRKAYATDKLFGKIIQHPKNHKAFELKDGLLHLKVDSETRALCVPHAEVRGRSLRELVLDQIHRTVGHMGPRITKNYARRYFWWPTLTHDIKLFCESCATCQATKSSNLRPQGLLHSLPIPVSPWTSIGMDFVGPFPQVDTYDYIWVVLCRLTSLVHIIPIHTTNTAAQLAPIFLSNIVRLHGLPDTIVSDRDPKFTSQFWTETHRLLGVKLARSTAFHPQTDGASERMIRKVSQVLRTVVKPDQLDWPKHLPMVEFALNSSVNVSTGYAPFELTYGYLPRTIQSIGKSEFAGVQEFADSARDMVSQAHDAIIESRVEQTHYANVKRRQDEPTLKVGRKAYLSTENLNLPKARARKLMPKFIGPYEIIAGNKETSSYTLALPEELLKRRIHPTFHAKLLRPAVLNDDVRFPNREATFFYDFGDDPEREWVVDSIVNHQFTGNTIQFDVLWDTGETTREPLSNCKDLQALDRYLELHGCANWRKLPRKGNRDARDVT
jgi:hypothetical protein